MAAININVAQFEDIVILYLLDKITDRYTSKGVRFKNLIKNIDKLGIKQYLYKYFLTTNADSKVKYKQVMNVLNGKKGQASIIVTEEFVKDIVSKVIGKDDPNPRKLKSLLEELNDENFR